MTELPTTKEGRTVIGEKSTVLAVILNILFAGLGILYAGNTKNGIITIIIAIFAVIVEYYSSYMLVITSNSELISLYMFITILFFFIYLVIMIYSIIICTKLCKENNNLWKEYLKSKN